MATGNKGKEKRVESHTIKKQTQSTKLPWIKNKRPHVLFKESTEKATELVESSSSSSSAIPTGSDPAFDDEDAFIDLSDESIQESIFHHR